MKRLYEILYCAVVVAAVLCLIISSSDSTTKSQLNQSPEASLAEGFSEKGTPTSEEEVTILAQCKNSKEQGILFKLRGENYLALFRSNIFGTQFTPLIANIDEGSEAPIHVCISGYFGEQQCVYDGTKFTLMSTKFALHQDLSMPMCIVVFSLFFQVIGNPFRKENRVL